MKFLKIALTRTARYFRICSTGRKKRDVINMNLTRGFYAEVNARLISKLETKKKKNLDKQGDRITVREKKKIIVFTRESMGILRIT